MRAMMRLITQNIYNQYLFIKEHKSRMAVLGSITEFIFFNSTQSDYSPIIT